MKINELDVVKLKDGRECTIVVVYNETDFLGEFDSEDGVELFDVKLSNIEEVTYRV